MRSVLRWGTATLSACALALLLAGAVRADDPKAPPDKAAPKDKDKAPVDKDKPVDRDKPVDKDKPGTDKAPTDKAAPGPMEENIYNTLRDVINEGADLYNNGDPAGCYRLYEGALRGLKPLLGSHTSWQDAITKGLTEAERNPSQSDRAFVLRRVIDQIRADIHPPKKPETPKPPDGTKPPDTAKTLWDRLGGEKGVTKVVDDVTALAAKDPKVNFTRNGKFSPTPDDIAAFKKSMVAWISSQAGGPIKYTGKSMKDAHKGMGITDAEFDALAADIRMTLDKDGVKADDAAAVLKAVEATRKDIVEKKQEDKKEGDKKEGDKKEGDK
jgi:hemoglobin